MGPGRLGGKQRLRGNRGPLFCRGVSTCKWCRLWFTGNALLEGDAHHPGRRKRDAGTRVGSGGGKLFAAAGFARVRWAERLRRFEGDEASAAIPGELWISRVHRGAPVSWNEVAA